MKVYAYTVKALAILLFCTSMALLSSCAKNKDDPNWVAEELVQAFIAADAARAKAVTEPAQWDRIDKYMKGRSPFECREYDWDGTGTSAVGTYDAKSKAWNWGFVYQCGSYKTPYVFQITYVLVRETGDGWKVYDWGKICEDFELPGRTTCR